MMRGEEGKGNDGEAGQEEVEVESPNNGEATGETPHPDWSVLGCR